MYGYGGDIKKPCASIQIRKVKEAAGMEIGEEVTVTITGTVKSIDSPRKVIDYHPGGSKEKMMPGSIELEITSIKAMAGDDIRYDDME